jgi:hypothetical protein
MRLWNWKWLLSSLSDMQSLLCTLILFSNNNSSEETAILVMSRTGNRKSIGFRTRRLQPVGACCISSSSRKNQCSTFAKASSSYYSTSNMKNISIFLHRDFLPSETVRKLGTNNLNTPMMQER